MEIGAAAEVNDDILVRDRGDRLDHSGRRVRRQFPQQRAP